MKKTINYLKNMVLRVNGNIRFITRVEKHTRFDIVHFSNGSMKASDWLNEQDTHIIRMPEPPRKELSLEDLLYLADLKGELFAANTELKMIRIDMEEDLANYDEQEYHSLHPDEDLLHDVYGNKLDEKENEIKEIKKKVNKLLNN